MQIGARIQQERRRELLVNKDKKKRHKKMVDDLVMYTKRNYMDCEYFIRMNKIFFIALVAC